MTGRKTIIIRVDPHITALYPPTLALTMHSAVFFTRGAFSSPQALMLYYAIIANRPRPSRIVPQIGVLSRSPGKEEFPANFSTSAITPTVVHRMRVQH